MELRMYGLVPYQLTGIQSGIQLLHSCVEYGLNNFNDKDYQDWASLHKTVILLNGGTTNINYDRLGTLNKHADYLESIGVKIARFHEPDLGDQLTAICFILNEKVFNKTLYPDYISYIKNKLDKVWSEEFDGWVIEKDYEEWRSNFNEDEETTSRIIKIRQFLKPLRLA
jgi:hypothetical protein